jgi:hypothetical protein
VGNTPPPFCEPILMFYDMKNFMTCFFPLIFEGNVSKDFTQYVRQSVSGKVHFQVLKVQILETLSRVWYSVQLRGTNEKFNVR